MTIRDENETRALRELLPWFENGTLDADEAEAVRALLATDLEANRQRRELRAMHEALAEDATLAANLARNLGRIEARIAAEDARTHTRQRAPWLALAAIVLLALGGGLFLAGTRVGAYRTLTAPAALPAVGADAALLRVDVAAGVDAAELLRLAGDGDARVLAGPSAYGVATLAVPRAHADAVLARLHADPRLRFAAEVPH